MLLVVVHWSPRGAAAALLVRVRVLKARRLLHLGGLFLQKGHKEPFTKAGANRWDRKRCSEGSEGRGGASEKSNLALGEAPDEGAASSFVAAGIRLVCRVRSILTFPLNTTQILTSL